MSPPSSTTTSTNTHQVQTLASESILPTEGQIAGKRVNNNNGKKEEDDLTVMKTSLGMPRPKTFEDPLEEREYLKKKLAIAFRIFAKFGFDEGVAGHITLRVSSSSSSFLLP